MSREMTTGKPTTRRYSPEEKAQAVRLVRQLRSETGQRHGAVKRVAEQLGYGVESVRSWVRQADNPRRTTAISSTLLAFKAALPRINGCWGSGSGSR